MKKLEKTKSILAFELGLPCIYFEETEKMVVFDRPKTESILNLKEYYKKKAKTQLKSTGNFRQKELAVSQLYDVTPLFQF